MSSPAALLTAVAGYGLAGAAFDFPLRPLGTAQWTPLLHHVRVQRLQGLLAEVIRDDALPVTAEQRQAAAAAHRDAMAQVIHIEQLLSRCAGALDEASIRFRVLKGSAVAHLDYPDPALRAFIDLDLLIEPGAMSKAVAALGAAVDARRRVPELRSGFDDQFAKSVTLATPAGMEIDLHRMLAMDAFGFQVDDEELFASATAFQVGGQAMPALAADVRFLHACYHAALGDSPPRLLPLRDVAQMGARHDFDPLLAVALAERWGGGAVVARAVSLSSQTLGAALPPALFSWSRSRESSRWERRALRAYIGPDRSQGRRALAAVAALPTVAARSRYLRALLTPDAEFLADRGGRWQWLQRGLARLVRRGR